MQYKNWTPKLVYFHKFPIFFLKFVAIYCVDAFFSMFQVTYSDSIVPLCSLGTSGALWIPGPSHHRKKKKTQVFRRKNEGFSKDSAFLEYVSE